mgnify:CR=1 FL=1
MMYTSAHSAGVFSSGTADFTIGAEHGGSSNVSNATVDEAAFWKRALSAADVTTLYNSGNGLAYANWNGNGLVYPQIIGSLIRPTPWSRFIAQTPIALLEAR